MSLDRDTQFLFREWLQNFMVDAITGAQTIISTVHHEVHEGEMFVASLYDAAIANGGNIALLITVSATHEAHMVFRAALGGDARFVLSEEPTVTDVGLLIPRVNMRRGSSRGAQTLARSNPTTTADGSILLETMLPGGTGGNAAGGALRQDTEFILRTGGVYLMRLTNVSGQQKHGSINTNWYEEDV